MKASSKLAVTDKRDKAAQPRYPAAVAVLDAGGQYVDLVRKASERLGYPAIVLPLDTPADQLTRNYKAIIISGSPANSHETTAPMPDPAVWDSGLPILGICYGMQAIANSFGGKVERGFARQDGRVTTKVNNKHPLFKDTKAEQTALFTHGNFVTRVPQGFKIIGRHMLGEQTAYSAIARGNIVGVQFHPEVFDDTPEGYQIFKNFLSNIAGLKTDPELVKNQTKKLIVQLRSEIREIVGDRHVIAFVSGGVDSSVAATLAASEILPEKLHAYYIDNGFMRDEDETVIELLKNLGVPVNEVDSTDYFSQAAMIKDGQTVGPLVDTLDPQDKRKIIGKAFIDVQNQLIAELKLKEAVLLQGTNAADRIESGHSTGGSNTALIKTHHNQVQEVQDLKARGLLLEPLDALFKDEIRTIGRFLGLPDVVVERHPFPGPGLAIRILCAGNSEVSKQANAVERAIQSHLHKRLAKIDHEVRSKLLPIRNVGVGGDERSHVAAVAIKSSADWRSLRDIAIELPAIFRDNVNRVILALGDSPIDNLSVTPTSLDEPTRLQLRTADRIVFEEMRTAHIIEDIKQCPVVLLPLAFGKAGERSVVLRPVTTTTFMTVQPMLPGQDLPEAFVKTTARRILLEVPGISQVFLDLTGKPPGTTEWE